MKGRGGNGQFQGVAPWLQEAWDLRAAGNFIGGGAGSGLLLASALAAWAGQPSRCAVLLGLVLVGAGLSSVALELGRPFRSLHVFFGGRRSWMTREAFVALVMFPLGVASLLVPVLMPYLAIPAAAYMYCQARMLRESKGIPAWRDSAITPVIIASALTEGSGLLIAVLAISGLVVAQWMAWLLLVVAVARLVAWLAYHRRLAGGGAPARVPPLLARFTPRFLLGGHALPAVLLGAALLVPDVAAPLAALAGLVAVLAGWVMKGFIVTKIAFNQGFAIPVTPVRGKGKVRAGTAPGWVTKRAKSQ